MSRQLAAFSPNLDSYSLRRWSTFQSPASVLSCTNLSKPLSPSAQLSDHAHTLPDLSRHSGIDPQDLRPACPCHALSLLPCFLPCLSPFHQHGLQALAALFKSDEAADADTAQSPSTIPSPSGLWEAINQLEALTPAAHDQFLSQLTDCESDLPFPASPSADMGLDWLVDGIDWMDASPTGRQWGHPCTP